MTRLGNVTVSLSDEDAEQLRTLARDTAYTALTGSFGAYAQGEALLGAGKGMANGQGGGNEALGIASLGLGAGVLGAFAGPAARPRPHPLLLRPPLLLPRRQRTGRDGTRRHGHRPRLRRPSAPTAGTRSQRRAVLFGVRKRRRYRTVTAEAMSLFKSRDDEAARLQSFVLRRPSRGWSHGRQPVTSTSRRSSGSTRSFDPTFFLAGATSLFTDVRAALSAGSIDPIAGRLSPELTSMFGNQLQYAMTTGHQLTMTSIDKVTATLRGVEADSAGDIVCLVKYDVVGRMGLVAAERERATGDPARGHAAAPLVRDLAADPTGGPDESPASRELPVLRCPGNGWDPLRLLPHPAGRRDRPVPGRAHRVHGLSRGA